MPRDVLVDLRLCLPRACQPAGTRRSRDRSSLFANNLSGKHFYPTSCGVIQNQRKKIRRLKIITTARNHFKGAFTYDVSKILANFIPPPPPVSIERPPPPPPLMTSAFARPPPPFQSDISFSKNPLHSTLIETLNVYLIQLKTELCRQFRGVY